MPLPPPQAPTTPARLLALDLGERRIGVAISDELGMFAHPRPALHVRSDADAVERITALVAAEVVAEVIVGLPLTLEGRPAAQVARIRPLIQSLRSRLAVPVTEWDERLSSFQAARQVTGKVRQRSGELDSAAAAVILQAVIDARRGASR